jgi:hypothetical protein
LPLFSLISSTAASAAISAAAAAVTIATAASAAVATATVSASTTSTAVAAAAATTVSTATTAAISATAAAVSTAAAATTIATTTAAAISATTPTSGFVGFFHGHLLSADGGVIQRFDRSLRLGLIRHIYKPEAFASSRFPIHHDLCEIHCAIQFEHFFQVHIIEIIGKTCNKKLHANKFKR